MMIGVTLTEFLLARIAEDEQTARPGFEAGQQYGTPWHWRSPARVLAECEAKRQMLKYCGVVDDFQDEYAVGLRDEILSALAKPYTGHSDYQEEWNA